MTVLLYAASLMTKQFVQWSVCVCMRGHVRQTWLCTGRLREYAAYESVFLPARQKPAAAVLHAGPEPAWSNLVAGSMRIAFTRPNQVVPGVSCCGMTRWPRSRN